MEELEFVEEVEFRIGDIVEIENLEVSVKKWEIIKLYSPSLINPGSYMLKAVPTHKYERYITISGDHKQRGGVSNNIHKVSSPYMHQISRKGYPFKLIKRSKETTFEVGDLVKVNGYETTWEIIKIKGIQGDPFGFYKLKDIHPLSKIPYMNVRTDFKARSSHYENDINMGFPSIERGGMFYLTYSCLNKSKENKKEKEKMTQQNKLYTFKKDKKTVYGKFLAEDADSKWVMKVEGTGEFVAMDPKDLEEVVPYTVFLKHVNGAVSDGFHFKTTKGSVKVGDLLKVKGYSGIWEVSKLDTKELNYKDELKGKILQTKEIK